MYKGYCYTRQKRLVNDVVSYECEKRWQNGLKQGQCKAKIRVRGQELVGRTNEHSHGPELSRGEVQKVRGTIRDRSTNTEETPQQIIATTLQQCSQGNNFLFFLSRVKKM